MQTKVVGVDLDAAEYLLLDLQYLEVEVETFDLSTLER